jgi:hypothetical protein
VYQSKESFVDAIEIINSLGKQLRQLDRFGIKGTADYANQPDERWQPSPFDSERFVKLRAVKSGKTERVEFRRIVEIEEVRRRGIASIANDFNDHATNALGKIGVE